MIMSLSRLLGTFWLTSFCAFVNAATITHNYNITWVTANPDGMYPRPVIGVNGKWPIPTIEITKSDRLIINVNNQLGNQSTSLHFHGFFQNGTTEMDGSIGVAQCQIPPGNSFTYNFTVDQPGTYWYHSHESAQYPDGLRAPFIVHDPDSPYTGKYDEQFILSLSDWYHDQMPYLMAQFASVNNPTGVEPVPDAALINDSQNVTFSIQPGKIYLFRIVNMGAFAGQYFWIEGHTMQIVEVDGVWTEAQDADMIYLTVAQRYSVLVTAKGNAKANFAITGSMDQDLFDTIPDTLNPNVTAWLQYDSSKPMSPAAPLDEFNPYDDFYLTPTDHEPLWEDPSQIIEMTMKMNNLGDGANYAFINDVTYVRPKVPTLYSVLTTGDYATNAEIYGVNANPFVLNHNEVIEIVLNNADSGKHPFHLHGHNFQAVLRSEENAGYYTTPTNATEGDKLAATPMRRDTFMVYPKGHYVIRFRSDNPGVWLFHCHIEWHLATGLIATIIEAPLELQKNLTIPDDHYQVCRNAGVPTQGNAAANTVNFLDLNGANVSPGPLPAGFTARGIVALVFSCISAVLGMAVISWYGAAPIGKGEFLAAKKRIQEAGVKISPPGSVKDEPTEHS